MSVAITQSKVTEMGEITLEADTINKFISSLGKSIQALCHGCMDFNNSIEMVGYININIDSGSFVDCVLNEKVQKSNANSMTCVSNSFHAKKDKPKLTKDASCSPVRRSDHGFEHPLSRRQHGFTSRESGHRGSARKRPRHFSKPGASSHDYYNSPVNTYQGPSASNTYQEPSASNTYQEQSTSHSTEYSNPEQLVKTELQEGTSSDLDPAASSSSFDVSVKNETDTTMLDTFSDGHEQNIQRENSENELGENRTGEKSNEMDESSSNSVRESNNMGKTSVQDSSHEDSFLSYHDSQNAASTHSQDYYNNREDNDDSQFEVIEIGDDDEDMQGFFDQPGTREMMGHPYSVPVPGVFNPCYMSQMYLPSSEYLESRRERQLVSNRHYRLNRTKEQKERERLLSRLRQRRRRARLRAQQLGQPDLDEFHPSSINRS